MEAFLHNWQFGSDRIGQMCKSGRAMTKHRICLHDGCNLFLGHLAQCSSWTHFDHLFRAWNSPAALYHWTLARLIIDQSFAWDLNNCFQVPKQLQLQTPRNFCTPSSKFPCPISVLLSRPPPELLRKKNIIYKGGEKKKSSVPGATSGSFCDDVFTRACLFCVKFKLCTINHVQTLGPSCFGSCTWLICIPLIAHLVNKLPRYWTRHAFFQQRWKNSCCQMYKSWKLTSVKSCVLVVFGLDEILILSLVHSGRNI